MSTKTSMLITKILVTVFAVLFGFMTVGTMILMENSGAINSELGVATYYLDDTNVDPDYDSMYYKSDFSNLDDVVAAGRAMGQKVEEEGAVLLKNNGALPVTTSSSNKTKVSLIGVTSVDPVYGGTGSGSVDEDDVDNYRSALESEDFDVNADLWNYYDSNADLKRTRSSSGMSAGNFVPGDADWETLCNAGLQDSILNDYNDATFVIIGRVGGEGYDLPTGNGRVPSTLNNYGGSEVDRERGNYLTLTTTEEDLLTNLANNKGSGINKLIVIINSANAFETDFLYNEDFSDAIDACLWIGSTGSRGLTGMARLISGSVTPSGRLSDTYYNDNIHNPVIYNFGDYTYENYETVMANSDVTQSSFNKYVVYQEGIYLGYRYTETRYEDVVLGTENAGDFDYEEAVGYPFGYGLSYANFEWSGFSVSYDRVNDEYTASVTVANPAEGTYSAKEVVQLYVQKPYTSGGIEKASVELVGFAKTETLDPGESETVDITISGRDFASYDADTAKTYIIDEGKHYLTAAHNAHDAINNILQYKNTFDNIQINEDKLYGVGSDGTGDASLVESYEFPFDDVSYKYSASTGNEITNLFDHADINKYDNKGNNSVTYMSRSNWNGTFPTDFDGVTLTMTSGMFQDMLDQMEIDSDDVDYPTYNENNSLQLIDLRIDDNGDAITYDDDRWDDFLDQLTWEETTILVTNGLRRTAYGVERLGKPGTKDHNGPVGLTQSFGSGENGLAYEIEGATNIYPTCYPCNGIVAATFNTELSEELGDMIGEEALWAGYSGLYGPCSNIHRSPYEGRCFEYYSEDGVLSGLILAHETIGIQAHGCYVYNKHFALNDQETNRAGVSTWLPEQAMREIYLRAFELPITVGDCKNVMTAFNRVGVIWAGGDYNLITEWLRGEAGMTGFAVTDMYSSIWRASGTAGVDARADVGSGYGTVMQMLMAGGDLPDGDPDNFSGTYLNNFAEGYGELAWKMRESAHRIMYTVVHSNAMNGIAPGTVLVSITPGWQIAVIAVEITLGVLLVASIAFGIVMYIRKRNKV